MSLELSDDYRDDCLFRTANLKRFELKDFSVKNFKGCTVLRNYGKNEGEIVFSGVAGLEGIPVITETDEEFTVDMI